MKYVATPEFSSKLTTLKGEPEVVSRLQSVLAYITKAADRADLITKLPAVAAPLQESVYVVRSGDLRVFLSFGTSDSEEYVLLLDLAFTSARPSQFAPSPAKDPKTNPTLNPQYNPSINPRHNASLNPAHNASINPMHNATLNPAYNASLNPRYNASLNPDYNASINPHYNASINPRYNPTINPLYNPTYAGPFVYNLQLDREAYFVRATDQINVVFDNLGEFIGIAVKNSINGYTLFDRHSEWIGYLVSTGQGSYLRFSPGGEWTGLVV